MSSINNILPTVAKDDLSYFRKNVFNGRQFQTKVETELKKYFPRANFLFFETGRDGLDFLAQNIFKPKDKIYLQAFTCSATISPFLKNQITPLYQDIDPKTLNLDLDKIKQKSDSQVKAVLIQYTFGLQPKKLDQLISYFRKKNILIVEDLAHSLGNKHQNKYLGNFGDLALLSLGKDKVISTVNGGVLVINNSELYTKLQKPYQQLKTPSVWDQGKTLFYLYFMAWAKLNFHQKLARSLIFGLQKLKLLDFPVSDQEKKLTYTNSQPRLFPQLRFALLYHQLKKLPMIYRQRRVNTRIYNRLLGNHYLSTLLKYPLLVHNPEIFKYEARKKDVYLSRWYSHIIDPKGVSLDQYQYQVGSCPQAETISAQIINLPTYLNQNQIQKITQIIKEQYHPQQQKYYTKPIKDRNIWDSFVKTTAWTPFFQAWDFGETQKICHYRNYRIGVFKQNKFVMAAQFFVIQAKRGTFLHLRHGPVFQKFDPQAFVTLLQALKFFARKHKAWFIRISPLLPDKAVKKNFFTKLGFIDAPMHNQDAENCLILDLSLPLETIFLNFRKTNRNLIRKAEKLGVLIKQSTNPKDLNQFLELYNQTAQRQGFVKHQGIVEEFKQFQAKNSIALFLGYYKGQLLAGSLIVFFGQQAFYHHSGSIPSSIPVNYLLQWEIIKEAKQRGMKYYNFWGIAPEHKPKHPWQGLTLFKKGFGGKPVDFLHALDLPLTKLYWFSYYYQKFWNWRKGYN